MSYFAPYVDASGLHTPTYTDIENFLINGMKGIFGSDIYLNNDSQDFQMLAMFAQADYDSMQALQLAYAARSPISANDTALDGIVAINGIEREAATFSTAAVTLTGTAYTVITNAVVSDINGNAWNLPTTITLDSLGAATVTATCQVAGAVTALTGQINVIQTPTYGWTSVTNANAASAGQPVETNSKLRARQAQSVSDPSQAITAGILGAVLAVPNVAGAQLYENDTNIVKNTINGGYNPGGFPSNSLTLVVTGGDGQAIANAMALRKTPGAYSNGDQTYSVLDAYGVPKPIRFYIPTTKTIDVAIAIKVFDSYSSDVGTAMIANVVDYINSLPAGQNVIISELERVALDVNDGQKTPYFSLTSLKASIDPAVVGSSDITINFNWQAITTTGSVSLALTSDHSCQFNNVNNSQYIPVIIF